MIDSAPPLVGIPANSDEGTADWTFHRVGDKYIASVINGARCLPVLIPALSDLYDVDDFLDRLDGIFLTGGASNIEPHNYGGDPSREGTAHDPGRDSCSLPLIRKAIEHGVPLFAVCRGVQELNVACGGTLHQNVHELPGKNDHRMRRDLPPERRYDERHPIAIKQGGFLMELASGASEVMVNSLHAQAIDQAADALVIEALSDDGIIEAVSVRDAKDFALGVQWHPEHPIPLQWPLSKAMFGAFGDAARARHEARAGRSKKRGTRVRNAA
jgi:putative glutamine amidotransferase